MFFHLIKIFEPPCLDRNKGNAYRVEMHEIMAILYYSIIVYYSKRNNSIHEDWQAAEVILMSAT